MVDGRQTRPTAVLRSIPSFPWLCLPASSSSYSRVAGPRLEACLFAFGIGKESVVGLSSGRSKCEKINGELQKGS